MEIKNKPFNKLNRAVDDFVQRVRREKRVQSAKKHFTYRDFLSNRMLLVHSIREGLPYKLFDLIREVTPFTEDDWADFLDLSSKSLQRYKSKSQFKFKPIHSEKIIELAEVTQLGLEVFGDMEKFKLWLQTPNFSLGSLKPIELMKDSYGKDLVIGELTRIDHGIFA
jgi:putative toxin-antitoxin system antitoxin component (TIGR02293 family)